MGGFSEYGEHDGLGLAALVRDKQVTPAELVEEAIDRIDRINPNINAVIHKLYDRAREQAAGELPAGPFSGVPFVLKDLLSALEGEVMESGSKFYRGWKPPENSELVNRYLATGAIVVGKTNTPELGLLPTTEPVAFGPSRNPWDRDRTTGGSSGGTAAAVAARLVPFGGGGDGGGSIRIPSSCCGLFGLKPSRGRTPTGPYEAEGWNGYAIEHVLTRSVRDSAAMLDAVSGPYTGDVHHLAAPAKPFLKEVGKKPGKLKIAVSTRAFLPGKADPECVHAVEQAVKLLEELGHEVVDKAPPIDGAAFAKAFLVVISCQTWAGLRAAEQRMGRPVTRDDVEAKTWITAQSGAAFSGGEYVQAVTELQRIARGVHRFAEDYDAMVNPTIAAPPPRLGFLDPKGAMAIMEEVMVRLPIMRLVKQTPVFEQAAADVFKYVPWTPVYNVTGQPSMSVPLHWNSQELPVGVMFTGKLNDEATLFRLAGQLEKARPWAERKPRVCA